MSPEVAKKTESQEVIIPTYFGFHQERIELLARAAAVSGLTKLTAPATAPSTGNLRNYITVLFD